MLEREREERRHGDCRPLAGSILSLDEFCSSPHDLGYVDAVDMLCGVDQGLSIDDWFRVAERLEPFDCAALLDQLRWREILEPVGASVLLARAWQDPEAVEDVLDRSRWSELFELAERG